MSNSVNLSFDVESLDWNDMTELYHHTFGTKLSPEKMKKLFTNSYSVCTARVEGRLIGAVYAISDGVLDATIHGLAVHPDYQGQGIATQMMKAILKELEGISILLTTEPEHIDYYRRLGFKKHKATMALRFPDHEVE